MYIYNFFHYNGSHSFPLHVNIGPVPAECYHFILVIIRPCWRKKNLFPEVLGQAWESMGSWSRKPPEGFRIAAGAEILVKTYPLYWVFAHRPAQQLELYMQQTCVVYTMSTRTSSRITKQNISSNIDQRIAIVL